MRKTLYLFTVVALLAACKSGTPTSGSTAAKADSVVMPYKASYSSSFAISDNSKNEQAVLQSYKDWEDGKLGNAAAYFADTIAFDFSNGARHKMARDSFVKFSQKFRDSLSSSKIDMISVVNLHATDKNEDWVSVWYKQTDTHKDGKIDSSLYNDVNHMKGGKIDYWTSLRQALKPAK
ncbi:putative periplasmic lipoprotein [Mucilaginibacter ginsenosidivorans]|uniref:Nuclear transport factor 2 family protein n=1 Tax=Mucilaginibacter ginsenosidivorans TaxID=398053 RepID=A0A5B8UXB6_9SPHI|nr:hypothetical protein [Mucilaginibacter ginsenosidivorans]QEC63305.1 hypothetical protein FRZ54_12195 [Mucilaginibacter ginsenosidivorans]